MQNKVSLFVVFLPCNIEMLCYYYRVVSQIQNGGFIMLEFKYDTQLLIEGTNLDEDEINDYITEHFKGCWLVGSRR